MTFDDTHPSLRTALANRGYLTPTPVQTAVLEPRAAGRDLLVSARTGSGKTVAFGLAIAPVLLGDEARLGPADAPLALVIAPTRELALQVQRELGWLYAPAGARVVSCVGGMDVRREQRALAQGAHLVVGTPGRLCDHLERGHLDLSGIVALVLDEADEMLDLGFRDELERILGAASPERRTLMFSATLPAEIVGLARRYQRDALRLALGGEDEPHGDIAYHAMPIAPQERDHAVVNVLRHLESPGALVFCATREGVTHLAANLLERGFQAVPLSGDLSQAERTRALQALRDRRARVCVATDVAARGLDLPDLGLVIHADLPQDRQVLQHRSGRTGRAGKKGVAVLLVPAPRRRLAERMLAAAGLKATWSPPPSADAIRARDQERLVAELAALAEEPAPEDVTAARALLERRTPEELVSALVRLSRERLPAPEELVASTALREGPRPAAPRRPPGDSVWFRLNVGRTRNADPRWLVPLICRRGNITKQELGKIRVLDRETRFEIAREVADRFAAAARRPDRRQPDVRIEPVLDGDRPTRPARKNPPR